MEMHFDPEKKIHIPHIHISDTISLIFNVDDVMLKKKRSIKISCNNYNVAKANKKTRSRTLITFVTIFKIPLN